MESKFQYIHTLAKRFSLYYHHSEKLFQELKEVSNETLIQVTEEYWSSDSRFSPVNLLRGTIAKKLLEGEEVKEEDMEEVKNQIRRKNREYFSYLPEKYLQQLENYPIREKDIFSNWKKSWSILYPFFYRRKEKERTRTYLNDFGKLLLSELSLKDYTYNIFDFQGSGHSGEEFCRITLYPLQKSSSKEAYQFFLDLGATPKAGQLSGTALREKEPDPVKSVTGFKETVRYLKQLKPDILKRNDSLRNYYTYAPKHQVAEWDRFFEGGLMALNFSHLPIGNLARYKDRESLEKAVETTLPGTKEAWELWLFKNARPGDMVFAVRGVNNCIGIGTVAGDYYYQESPDGFCHRRKVEWITNKTCHFNPGSLKGYKTLFPSGTFLLTRHHDFLLKTYREKYPELSFDRVKKRRRNKSSYGDQLNTPVASSLSETEISYETPDPKNYWWLNLNPGTGNLPVWMEGENYLYPTHNERGNKKRIYRYFEELRPGDMVIGYESTPSGQIRAILEITRGIHSSGPETEMIGFEVIELFEYPVNREEIKGISLLKGCEAFSNDQGNLFSLTEEEFELIREVADEKNITAEQILQNNRIQPYAFREDPDFPFMEEETFLRIVTLLKRKKNIILQGPPGVGKTFLARKLAYEMMQETNDLSIEMVQFHQSYGYEDFIQGLRPAADGSFEVRDGIFHTFCQRARNHPDKPYFFIIDEINRGNLSRIFGELLLLIEADKRGWEVKLTYGKEEDSFSVPPNIYMIGTMNTADRSLAIVDYALRRRFAFISLSPLFNNKFKAFLHDKGVSDQLTGHIISSISGLNRIIREDMNLGEGFQIGHSFFCSFSGREEEQEWWKQIIEFEIKPLLEELWFDDPERSRQMEKKLALPKPQHNN